MALFKKKLIFFILSHDCVRWKLLNPPTEDHMKKLSSCKGRFTGDPSHEFECKSYKLVGQGDEERLEEEVVSFVFFFNQ